MIRERRLSRQFLAAAEVAAFAGWRGIARSPGRGAAPSSLVAHALGVTGVDPVAHGLIFERFLNARLAVAANICLDVCADRRAEVIDFAMLRMGGTPVMLGDTAVFSSLGIEIDGLPALTFVQAALDRVNRERGRQPIDLAQIPLDDPATFDRLALGGAIGPHGLDAGWLLRAIRPECFEDVVAAVALSRPGPQSAGMAGDFVRLKQRRFPVEHEHPLLANTHGIIVYQEQIMQIAVSDAGYPPGDADVFRRVLGRQQPEAVARERDRFLRGAGEAGVTSTDAARIFFRLQRSAPFSFNRSHAVPMALIVYWAAYLEAHLPGELLRPPT
jgi:DNA polymerase III alpha subunit